MIDQNILYSECPCGSGKKFKFCCYPSIRSELPPNPTRTEVVDTIRQRSQSTRLAEAFQKGDVVDLFRFHRLLDRGLEYLSECRYSEAEAEFLRVKEEFGFLPTAYNNLALCALIQGDLDKTEKIAREVMQRFPEENPYGMAIYADVLYIKGNIVGALDVIARVENITPPSVDQAVRTCETMAHFNEHGRIAHYIMKYGYSDNPEAAFFLGIAFANLGRENDAIKFLRIALKSMMSVYVKSVLDKLIAGEKADTISGDWAYFTPINFPLLNCLSVKLETGGAKQVDLSAEAYAEFIEVKANSGLLDLENTIALLGHFKSKRAERILNALQSDESRPEGIRRLAEKVYSKTYGKKKLGEKMRNIPYGQLQKIQITTEGITQYPLAPEYEADFRKAVQISIDPASKKSALREAVQLLEGVYAKVQDNPAVANNYAYLLSRFGDKEKSEAIIKECFANHPEYVFGAANYLSILITNGKIDEAKAMHDNYQIPQTIHPEAYLAWCRVEMMYFKLIDDKERLRNVKKSVKLIEKEYKW